MWKFEDVADPARTSHKRYTVRYRDANSTCLERCYYASDAYEARVLAMESVRYIHDHPHAIDLIRCESQQWLQRVA